MQQTYGSGCIQVMLLKSRKDCNQSNRVIRATGANKDALHSFTIPTHCNQLLLIKIKSANIQEVVFSSDCSAYP